MANAIDRKAGRWSLPQRIAHWLVVILCLSQIPTSWAIDRSHVAHVFNLPQSPVDLFFHQVHIWIGIAIAFIAAGRVIMRLVLGAPPLPAATRPVVRILSGLSHWALYLLLGLSPVCGFLAAYVSGLFGPVHVALNWTLLAVACLHVAGALFHHLVLKDDVLKQMIRG